MALIGCGWCGKGDLFKLIQVADIEEGHISTGCCILANISMQISRLVVYDAKTRTVLNDAEATALLQRNYWQGWGHPNLNWGIVEVTVKNSNPKHQFAAVSFCAQGFGFSS